MEIQSTISNFPYYDSEEQVDAINNSKERVDVISDSNELVDAVSEEKAYRDYIFKNEFEKMNMNSGSRINPDSWINSLIRINYPIRPTFNIPLTLTTEYIPLTRPTYFELLK